jgi:AraC-like DNA-binding protein
MAGVPRELIETPERAAALTNDDVLSDVLRTIRLSGSLQFCLVSAGAWQTDDRPTLGRLAGRANTVPFHVVVEGGCWLRLGSETTELVAGDVVAFPFGTGHALGVGREGRVIDPTRDLPPKPWREVPVLRYGDGPVVVRLLCGYLRCDALDFAPLREALPPLLHLRTAEAEDAPWLAAAIRQLAAEADRPRAGGLSMIERLTEIVFIELLRHQIAAARPRTRGWLAALSDRALGRCLSLIHSEAARDWSVPGLAAACGLSRSSLTERFETVLGISPMRYLRAWRLYLASVALSESAAPVAEIAYRAGYGTEAAFTRAFARAYGAPPATWRRNARAAG